MLLGRIRCPECWPELGAGAGGDLGTVKGKTSLDTGTGIGGRLGMPLSLLVQKIGLGLFSGFGMGG